MAQAVALPNIKSTTDFARLIDAKLGTSISSLIENGSYVEALTSLSDRLGTRLNSGLTEGRERVFARPENGLICIFSPQETMYDFRGFGGNNEAAARNYFDYATGKVMDAIGKNPRQFSFGFAVGELGDEEPKTYFPLHDGTPEAVISTNGLTLTDVRTALSNPRR